MDPKTVKRIKESPWRPAEEGETYAYRVVLWERAEGEGYPGGSRPYCSHMEIDDTGSGTRPFYQGHYDMTFDQAGADFIERCRVAGIPA